MRESDDEGDPAISYMFSIQIQASEQRKAIVNVAAIDIKLWLR